MSIGFTGRAAKILVCATEIEACCGYVVSPSYCKALPTKKKFNQQLVWCGCRFTKLQKLRSVFCEYTKCFLRFYRSYTDSWVRFSKSLQRVKEWSSACSIDK